MRGYLEARVQADLKRKMSFMSEPRQVGKSTLARNIRDMRSAATMNSDVDAQRERILLQS